MIGRRQKRLVATSLLAAALVGGCTSATTVDASLARRTGPTPAPPSSVTPLAEAPTVPPTTIESPTTAPPVPATATTASPAPAPSPAAAPPPPAPAPAAVAAPAPVFSRPRTVQEQAWTPFATVGGVVLHHPSSRVERVAFHESNHDGARQLEPLPTAADPADLETRERGTGSRSAADVVVDPDAEIRAPVTGRVVRAGTYVLYCDNSDDYLVVEPDAHPGWEVKMLHIDGVMVSAGARVQAGETVVAPRATRLPFTSQVDEVTASPAWPHVHIEVVDPSIPDRPSGGRC